MKKVFLLMGSVLSFWAVSLLAAAIAYNYEGDKYPYGSSLYKQLKKIEVYHSGKPYAMGNRTFLVKKPLPATLLRFKGFGEDKNFTKVASVIITDTTGRQVHVKEFKGTYKKYEQRFVRFAGAHPIKSILVQAEGGEYDIKLYKD